MKSSNCFLRPCTNCRTPGLNFTYNSSHLNKSLSFLSMCASIECVNSHRFIVWTRASSLHLSGLRPRAAPLARVVVSEATSSFHSLIHFMLCVHGDRKLNCDRSVLGIKMRTICVIAQPCSTVQTTRHDRALIIKSDSFLERVKLAMRIGPKCRVMF